MEHTHLKQINLYFFFLKDHGTPQLSSLTTIQIFVSDIDDKDPLFSKSFYTGFVKRNSLPVSITYKF
jgi:hypothetical protein